jgi:hypothetical protein
MRASFITESMLELLRPRTTAPLCRSHLEVFRTRQALDALAPAWSKLFSELKASPFQSPDWLIPFGNIFVAENDICILAWFENHELIALAPFYFHTEMGCRKLLLLARAAGAPLEWERVSVESLLPRALAEAGEGEIDARLPLLDAPLRRRYQQAYRDGAGLRFIGRFEVDARGAWHASVGLRALPGSHPLSGGSGTDNRVAIQSCRYRHQPLVIQGPGAGADITAAALIDDVLRIARTTWQPAWS